jgi:hypothetical protein
VKFQNSKFKKKKFEMATKRKYTPVFSDETIKAIRRVLDLLDEMIEENHDSLANRLELQKRIKNSLLLMGMSQEEIDEKAKQGLIDYFKKRGEIDTEEATG